MKRINHIRVGLMVGLCVVIFSGVSLGQYRGVIFVEDFDEYSNGADLSSGKFGGWVGRWGGNIAVTADEAISSTPCAKMDNSSGCWESQLYHALPFHEEVWISADIMAEAAGRTGCHQMDAEIRLFNPDVGQWGRAILGIGIASRKTEWHDGPGLVAFSGHCELNGKRQQYDSVILEEDYERLTGRWINVMARVNSLNHQADIWIDDEYKASIQLDANFPKYAGLSLDCSNGTGYVDNIYVFTNEARLPASVGAEPAAVDLQGDLRWITCRVRLPSQYNVADVNPDKILLNSSVKPTWAWVDEQEQVVMAKFPLSRVRRMLVAGTCELTVQLELADGTGFEGTLVVEVTDAAGPQ
ncbi:MAG: hypothetical protein ACYTBJ_04665 [Planctomycetota bacterium]|jgi:hypothetical protein